MAWEKFTTEVIKDCMHTGEADFDKFSQLFLYFVPTILFKTQLVSKYVKEADCYPSATLKNNSY
ncbi:hypothetical protein [Flavobacterium sp. T12S277]|uniref:hypothetical protein n=1 Tax=Flavobacterium sp. T12S277 TaxID=3402752 RepID=UPI003AE42EFF